MKRRILSIFIIMTLFISMAAPASFAASGKTKKMTVYTDVIKISDSNSSSYSVERIANEYFIWSKSKGLLQYKYLNGEVYTFYKKIPRKK